MTHEAVMETKWHDRSDWGLGAWDAEPQDKEHWKDPASGLDCLAVRNAFGAWCGYVGVPPGHALHGSGYSADALDSVRVHGGLTYAAKCGGRICHPADGDAPVWWFGFDCAHGGDALPTGRPWGDGEYRTLDYVRGECATLAATLAAEVSR